MNSDWRTRYDLAVELTRRAGQHALKYFDTGLAVEQKPDKSPVTIADRETEQLLRKGILAKFPGDGFLGEEYGDSPGTSGYRWIIDPIDGTRNFVRGIPLWGTLVALEFRGEQIAGVVSMPAFNQLYRALRGDGAFRDERRIRVSEIADMSQAQMFYSSLSWFLKSGCGDIFQELAVKTHRQRGFGDVYPFVLVAQGSGELMVEHGVHAWDVAATQPIIEEAGGRFSNWDGSVDIHRPDILVSNGKLHDEAIRILSRARVQEQVRHV